MIRLADLLNEAREDLFRASDQSKWPKGPFGKKGDFADYGGPFKKSKDWKYGPVGRKGLPIPKEEEDDAKETGYKKVDEIDSSLNEFQGKRLAVFDFDDTLAKSEAYIYVTKANGEEIKLDPAKYAVYEEEPGDKFDFRDFNSKLKNPQTIDDNVKRLKAELGNPQTKVTVLTARELAFPLRHFFKNEVGISPYVVGVGSSDPMKKAKWIEAHIKKGYNSIFFIDDSPKNIAAVDTLKQKYPDLDIETELAE